MIAYAKANPGKLTWPRTAKAAFLTSRSSICAYGRFTFTHIPYKGRRDRDRRDRGQVRAAIDGITGLTPHVRSGRLRLLPSRIGRAFRSGRHTSGGRDGPRLRVGRLVRLRRAAEAAAIILKLNEEINRAMKLPDVSDKLVTAGLIVVAESPEYFGEVIRSDYAKYGKLVRDIGFQPQ